MSPRIFEDNVSILEQMFPTSAGFALETFSFWNTELSMCHQCLQIYERTTWLEYL